MADIIYRDHVHGVNIKLVDMGDGTHAPAFAGTASGGSSSTEVGSHVYGYTAGLLTSDAWTVSGITKTKTYTYTAGVLTAESDWV